jgi:hypothetical protein
MEAKLGVLIIHGVGSQEANFADPIKKKLERRISDHDKIRWQSIYWAPILSEREDALWRLLFPEEERPHRSEWRKIVYFVWRKYIIKLKKFVINLLGDVTAYKPVNYIYNNTYEKIHNVVHKSVVELRKSLGNEDKPIIVIAHSLGSVIMSDYIYDRQNNKNAALYGTTPFERMETLAGFITSGSPIPLFTLANDVVESIIFPPENLPVNLKDKVKWLNFYDPDDVLGCPLKNLSDSYKACVSEDKPINVGGILTSWNPLCHYKYWTDDNFIKPVARYISEISKACL